MNIQEKIKSKDNIKARRMIDKASCLERLCENVRLFLAISSNSHSSSDLDVMTKDGTLITFLFD